MMTKSIKLVEEYMKRIGRTPLLWDEQVIQFLRINDQSIAANILTHNQPNRLVDEELKVNESVNPFKDSDLSRNEFIIKLFEPISVIENY